MSSQLVTGVEVERNTPVFEPDDFEGNVRQLLEHFGYRTPGDVPVASYMVHVSKDHIVEEEVKEGKYRSALFLYYLFTIILPGMDYNCFGIDPKFRFLVQGYFGDEICQDVIENPETKHKTVKALLTGIPVVFLVFEPHH